MYPEGEFLCIVSKQYDRSTREDQNIHVSERVKVRLRNQLISETICFSFEFLKILQERGSRM